jgi:diguanylate cyclase (GGDEF)-like protein
MSESYQGVHLLSFLGPAILFMFSLTFVAAWTFDRSRTYILNFAGAFLLYCAGALSQILHIPPDIGPNALISGALYAAAGICIVEGLLRRTGLRTPLWFVLAVPALMVGALAWFFYVERNLLARVYLQNFGFGVVFLFGAWWLRGLRRGSKVDRVIFWLMVVFGLHFFPRTILSIGMTPPPPGLVAFAVSPFWQVLQFTLSLFGAMFGLTLLAATGADLMAGLRRDGITDQLTDLLNRRGFDGLGRRRLAGGPGTCIMVFDIDKFKSINDQFGHAAGDAVIRGIASIVEVSRRKGDLAARIGGEEFAILLRSRDAGAAFAMAEQLRKAIEATRFPALPVTRTVTASFGVAGARKGEGLWELVARADTLLYEAKRTGRNRTCADFADPG